MIELPEENEEATGWITYTMPGQDIRIYSENGKIVSVACYEDCWYKSLSPLMEEVRQQLGSGPVYISFDIDGLDPAFAQGTGTPEIGGLTPRDAQVILRSLQGRELVGADISEVSPCFDPTGITCITVANLMFEILCVIAHSVAARRSG